MSISRVVLTLCVLT